VRARARGGGDAGARGGAGPRGGGRRGRDGDDAHDLHGCVAHVLPAAGRRLALLHPQGRRAHAGLARPDGGAGARRQGRDDRRRRGEDEARPRALLGDRRRRGLAGGDAPQLGLGDRASHVHGRPHQARERRAHRRGAGDGAEREGCGRAIAAGRARCGRQRQHHDHRRTLRAATRSRMMPRRGLAERLRRPLQAVTFWYAVFAALWIYFSDAVLGRLVRDPERLVALSVYKGLAFVAVTTLLLWLMMRRFIGTVVSRELAERQRHDTLVAGQQRILEGVAHGSALRTSLEEIVRFIEGQAPGMSGSILLLDGERRTVRHGAGPSLPPEYMEAIDGAPIGPMAGSCGTAAFTREPVYVEDIDTDPRWADYKQLALPHGLRACWSTPIFDAEGKVLGTFAMYYREPGLPGADHRQLIEVATQLASIAISRARTEQALHEAETRFVAFMDAAPAIAWVSDEAGRHLWMNRAWSAAFGRDREQFVGHRADE